MRTTLDRSVIFWRAEAGNRPLQSHLLRPESHVRAGTLVDEDRVAPEDARLAGRQSA